MNEESRSPATVTGSADERDAELIPISALQHVVYCPRQAALIHLERMWDENIYTAEGLIAHLASDRGDRRSGRGVRRVHALPLASMRLGIAGVADLVEFAADPAGETVFPVEYKSGKPKRHQADEVQLCAQALCLEEMTGRPVLEGAIFYATTRRRLIVAINETLRATTEAAVATLTAILASGVTPPPTTQKSRCRSCSLAELCRPRASAKDAVAWRAKKLAALLADVE